jgi:hypothetical protein
MARAAALSGTSWSRLLLYRSAGMVHTPSRICPHSISFLVAMFDPTSRASRLLKNAV